MIKLTQKQAEDLIEMLKRYVEKGEFNFPEKKGKIEFDVIGKRRGDEFTISISRKGKKYDGCSYQGRIKSNHIILMRLDINPTAIHRNPNGEEIIGSHLHVYTEKYREKEAVLFEADNPDLYKLCFAFFEKFNVLETPKINQQKTIFDIGG